MGVDNYMGEQLQGFFWRGNIENYYLGHQMAEIYKDKLYHPYFPNDRGGSVCLEIGAHIGIATYLFSHHFDKVYAIEPSLEHFDLLQMMVRSNDLKNVTPIKAAVWIENKQMPFFHNKNKTMFSLHMAVNDGSSKEEMVDGMTFDKIFNDYKIDHVNLMKLDVEGSEVELLSSTGFKQVSEKIDTIVLEVHAWNNRHPNQVEEALRNSGFTYIRLIPNDASIIVAMRKEPSIL